MAFREWLLEEEQRLIDQAVLDGYERAFRQGLEALIQRTRDPALKRAFEGMRGCPVRDGSGACRGWCDYIIGSMIRHGCHKKHDPEEVFQYVAFQMLSSVGERGRARRGIFDFEESRPYDLGRGNPVEVLFKIYLRNALRSFCSGRIQQMSRPAGLVSIGHEAGEVSPEGIAARGDSGEQEMLADLVELLRKRSTPDLDLVGLFQSILSGEGTREQRRRFGRKADLGRKIILGSVQDYAQKTQNWHLQRLLDKFKDFDPRKATRPKRPKPQPRPKLPPREQDYRSIVAVLERHGRAVGLAVLGKARRRWLERCPRNPSSPHPNRLADVLANMVQDGVLRFGQTRFGGKVYLPGPNYEQYLPSSTQG